MYINGRNRTVMLAAVVALVASLFVLAAPASAQASCYGRRATIVAQPGVTTIGTSGPDVIVGTSGNDIIKGRGGNDLICSGAGADRVFGGKGRDIIDLGTGADYAKGGSGHDQVEGGSGNDLIRGKSGRDVIRGQNGVDRCYGGPGKDSLHSCNEAAPATTTASLSSAEAEMASLVNNLRASVGAPSLRVSSPISNVARDWSRQLPSSFRHNPSVGSQIPSGWRSWGENIAYNSSVRSAFNALVDSPGHYANMTNPNFRELGVGVHNSGGWVYVTQVFASY